MSHRIAALLVAPNRETHLRIYCRRDLFSLTGLLRRFGGDLRVAPLSAGPVVAPVHLAGASSSHPPSRQGGAPTNVGATIRSAATPLGLSSTPRFVGARADQAPVSFTGAQPRPTRNWLGSGERAGSRATARDGGCEPVRPQIAAKSAVIRRSRCCDSNKTPLQLAGGVQGHLLEGFCPLEKATTPLLV